MLTTSTLNIMNHTCMVEWFHVDGIFNSVRLEHGHCGRNTITE